MRCASFDRRPLKRILDASDAGRAQRTFPRSHRVRPPRNSPRSTRDALVGQLRGAGRRDRARGSARDGGYGRRECIEAVVGAAAADAAAPPLVTAREARDAQRVIDAFSLSGGAWINVRYD